MNNLQDLRNKIDGIDDEIVKLFLQRMDIVKTVAEVKVQENAQINNSKREKEILLRLTEKVPEELKSYLIEIYNTIFTTSKAYQGKFVKASSKTALKIMELSKGEFKDLPVCGNVACQGVEGAFSGIASEKFFKIANITYFKNFEGVFSAVDKGFCEYGVLPIENSTAGSVFEVYDLMKKHKFSIVRSIKLKVDHCLATNIGVELSDVKKVVSHKQALLQCSNYLKNLKVECEIEDNTAIAAKKLKESGDTSVAVICSRKCAEEYSLKILDSGIQDSSKNYTRFILITKDMRIYNNSNKISVMVSLEHTPGSLYKILGKFNALNLNLTKLESRPIVNSDFEFMFYFDFDGNVLDKEVLELLSELENSSENFIMLGAYKEIV